MERVMTQTMVSVFMILIIKETTVDDITIKVNSDELSDISTTEELNMSSPILPGGGFMSMKAKLTVTISAMTRPKQLSVKFSQNMFEIKDSDTSNNIEIVSIANGKGPQIPEHIPIVMVWESKKRKLKMDEEMIIEPGVIEMLSGTKIMFLIAEVKEGVRREDVFDSLKSPEILKWLGVCDQSILQENENSARRLFHNLSRAAEGMVTEITGPNLSGANGNTTMLTLARSITEQHTIVDVNSCVNLFVTYGYNTMKMISVIDQDCYLILSVITMSACKYNLMTHVVWKQLGLILNVEVGWPMLTCNRR